MYPSCHLLWTLPLHARVFVRDSPVQTMKHVAALATHRHETGAEIETNLLCRGFGKHDHPRISACKPNSDSNVSVSWPGGLTSYASAA